MTAATATRSWRTSRFHSPLPARRPSGKSLPCSRAQPLASRQRKGNTVEPHRSAAGRRSGHASHQAALFRLNLIGGAIMDPGITGKPSLDISTRTVGGITIAELVGELDTASAPALREQLLSLLRPGSSRLVIDLSKVSRCDASGLAVLIGTGRQARLLGGFLRLAAVSLQADRVLHITGLHRHLPTSPLSTQPQPAPPTPSTAEQARSPKWPLPPAGPRRPAPAYPRLRLNAR